MQTLLHWKSFKWHHVSYLLIQARTSPTNLPCQDKNPCLALLRSVWGWRLCLGLRHSEWGAGGRETLVAKDWDLHKHPTCFLLLFRFGHLIHPISHSRNLVQFGYLLYLRVAPAVFFLCCWWEPTVYRLSLPLPVVLSEACFFFSAVKAQSVVGCGTLRSLEVDLSKTLGWSRTQLLSLCW